MLSHLKFLILTSELIFINDSRANIASLFVTLSNVEQMSNFNTSSRHKKMTGSLINTISFPLHIQFNNYTSEAKCITDGFRSFSVRIQLAFC